MTKGERIMSEEMRKTVEAMPAAADEMPEREAKLGNKVVIGDKHGNPQMGFRQISCPQTESGACSRPETTV